MMKELNDIDEGKLTTHVRLLNDIAKCVPIEPARDGINDKTEIFFIV